MRRRRRRWSPKVFSCSGGRFRLLSWCDAATDADIARHVPFKSRFVGNAGLPAWQIVMHVVNHATLHRGQIVGMLRQLGVQPPATDIVFYYYEQAATAAS
jgi:uncharacterized damage-inducible protein DinB